MVLVVSSYFLIQSFEYILTSDLIRDVFSSDKSNKFHNYALMITHFSVIIIVVFLFAKFYIDKL